MLNKQIFAYKEANPLCIMTNLLFYIPPFPEQFDHRLLPGIDWQELPMGKESLKLITRSTLITAYRLTQNEYIDAFSNVITPVDLFAEYSIAGLSPEKPCLFYARTEILSRVHQASTETRQVPF